MYIKIRNETTGKYSLRNKNKILFNNITNHHSMKHFMK